MRSEIASNFGANLLIIPIDKKNRRLHVCLVVSHKKDGRTDYDDF